MVAAAKCDWWLNVPRRVSQSNMRMHVDTDHTSASFFQLSPCQHSFPKQD
jgi:hypothetical protein